MCDRRPINQELPDRDGLRLLLLSLLAFLGLIIYGIIRSSDMFELTLASIHKYIVSAISTRDIVFDTDGTAPKTIPFPVSAQSVFASAKNSTEHPYLRAMNHVLRALSHLSPQCTVVAKRQKKIFLVGMPYVATDGFHGMRQRLKRCARRLPRLLGGHIAFCISSSLESKSPNQLGYRWRVSQHGTSVSSPVSGCIRCFNMS